MPGISLTFIVFIFTVQMLLFNVRFGNPLYKVHYVLLKKDFGLVTV